MTPAIICVFAKPPVAGAVKTRLAADVGDARAAELARAFLDDTWAAVTALPWARAVLATPDGGGGAWAQGGGDLGARLERVLSRALGEAGVAIAIGADTPGLPPRLLEAARDALATADAVIGPADDGGFYLLGLRRCPPGLLADLPWSAPDTCARTLAHLAESGLSTIVIEPWFDVDRREDLDRLARLIASGAVLAPATAKALDR